MLPADRWYLSSCAESGGHSSKRLPGRCRVIAKLSPTPMSVSPCRAALRVVLSVVSRCSVASQPVHVQQNWRFIVVGMSIQGNVLSSVLEVSQYPDSADSQTRSLAVYQVY
ncbi:hypothetical protein J6590_015339 [Homalodisca vitripennis]|nr:hypothetical protein J6590_015339 [Homalodisca vitripennis]